MDETFRSTEGQIRLRTSRTPPWQVRAFRIGKVKHVQDYPDILSGSVRGSSQVQWHSYTPHSELPIKEGIRGLPLNTDVEEIKEALLDLCFPVKVVRLITPKFRKRGVLYYIQLEHLHNK